MEEKNPWLFVSIFPNLYLANPIETKYAIIVNENDDRLKRLQKESTIVDNLTKSFVDTRLKEIQPAFLLIHTRLKTNRKFHNAIVSFRNIVAISVILEGWLNIIFEKKGTVLTTLYSDYYDLFPLGRYSDKTYSIQTPALFNIVSRAVTKYQQNYSLPDTRHFYFYKDDELFLSLVKMWEDHFVRRKKNHYYDSLFRSLQMVYSACKLPTDNFSTFYDYGTKIGLWISSFEILFHSGSSASVGYKQIVNEFSQYQFSNDKLNKTEYKIDKTINSNIIGRIYKDLYDARNEFFHGNPVIKDNLFAFNSKKYPALTSVAPVLYFIALQLFLKKNNLLKKKIFKNYSDAFFAGFKRIKIEDIFIKFYKKLNR